MGKKSIKENKNIYQTSREAMEYTREKAGELMEYVSADRIEKIVIAAMKQSRKAWKPIVNPLALFEEIMSRRISGSRFICHCYEEVERSDFFNTIQQPDSPEDITVMIGPEGDFSIDEVKRATSNGYLSASLGVARLRTETAGLSAMMMMQMARRL